MDNNQMRDLVTRLQQGVTQRGVMSKHELAILFQILNEFHRDIGILQSRVAELESTPEPAPVVEEPVEDPVVETHVEVPDFDEMTKRQLEDFGRTVGVELDRRMTKANMISALTEHMSDG